MNTTSIFRAIPWPATLQFSILGFVLLPLIIISAVGVGYFVSVSSQIEEDRLKEELSLLARAVRLPIGQSLEQAEIDDVQSALDSVFEIGRVYGASIYNVYGDRIASAGIAERNLVNTRVVAETVETGEMQERFREVDGLDVFSQFLPVVDTGGRINGLVQITRRSSDFDAAIQQLQITAWTIWFVLVGVMTIIVVLGHYGSVGRYVRNLLQTMAQVERGVRSRRAIPAGPRELANISDGLNRMLDGIERAKAQVSSHQETEKQLNERLRDQEKMAAIGRVARGVAHELGAPLSVINGRTRRLRNLVGSDVDGDRQLNAIQQQVQRLNRIVRQLLEYCRPDAAKLGPVDLAEIAEDAVAALAPELPGRQADTKPVFEISVETDPLPTLTGDPARLELALVNLLRNSAQAGAKQVSIRIQANYTSLSLVVEDDGAGLREPAEKLQEPFFTTKLPGEGTGLGLAIVDNVASEHDASLKINDTGAGCRVEIEFPFKHIESEQETAHDGD
ncbi:MAG: HAMP domain-containing sensor histidine kinase [Pseudohongiellaceae bacterium]